MSIKHLIFQNLKKNIKNYYLYVFALIFSVSLYFAFVTLQYDPAMNEVEGSVKGAAAIKSASILLVAIVAIFLLYANTIFIKRRSKEIGLFQLIGMTKNRIFRILTLENFMLYFGSLLIGILLGFSVSKLIIMILFKVMQINAIAELHFSTEALAQTLIVFAVIYLLIMFMNYLFIKRQSILALFRIVSSTETRVKKLSIWEIVIGAVGIIMILSGYYISSKLFGGDFTTINELFLAMIFILGSVILGTYLFYKGSISFIFNIIRKKKDGYLTIKEVLSLSSIMFRMKSNALLLTIITTVSALAIGLLSLSYISYYSIEKTAEHTVAGDFSFTNVNDGEKFEKSLAANNISFHERKIRVIQVDANLKNILDTNLEELNFDPKNMKLPVISEQAVDTIDVAPGQAVFTDYNNALQKFMSFKASGQFDLIGKSKTIQLTYLGLRNDSVLSLDFTAGGLPVVIVNQTDFERLQKDINPAIQNKSTLFIGIDVKNEDQLEKANQVFNEFKFNGDSARSRLEISNGMKQIMGLTMFIVGFLGLTFLVTSGCILYFKQMGESEEEKPNYSILRKLGFTRSDLLKGISRKQLFSFGIPLVIGLAHSYFAVKSGWFFFGTELWTPMIIVMILYAALYSVFGILSVLYYKKVIRDAL